MSNFFAQPDALAYGKTVAELVAEGVPAHLHAHKEFPGNRPSLSILFPELNAYKSFYDHYYLFLIISIVLVTHVDSCSLSTSIESLCKVLFGD